MNLLQLGFGLIFFAAIVECNNKEKRQVTFGFGIPNTNYNPQASGHALGQAIGGTINNLLGGLLGTNRPQGCDVNNGGCQQGCAFRRNRVQCYCNPGYVLQRDQLTCIDINECTLGPEKACEDQCVNTDGSFRCVCTNGILLLDGRSCGQAAVSCAVNNGGCQQECKSNPRKAVHCKCTKGYILAEDKRSCLDIDECSSAAHNCRPEQKCVNNVGGFQCTLAGLTSCGANNGGCEHRCIDNKQGTRCACRKGFVLQEDGKSCLEGTGIIVTPTDPCAVDNGGCEQLCVNLEGTVHCECDKGFLFVSGLCQREIIPPSQSPIQSTTLQPIPPKNGCGVNTKKSLFRRIVGGKPADPKDWPWMAAILKIAGNRQFCGGTLITDQHILTAAHCIISFKVDDLVVRLGEYNFDTADENNPTDFRVAEIKMHQGYNQQTQENDIAILKLARPSSFSEYIWPACLPPPNVEFEDQLGYVTGWGTIHFGGPVSTVLQEVVIPVWKQTDCVAAYPENKVSESMMCAGLKAGGKDSCQGDSGGPFLVQIFPDTRWFVAGIVSWGVECASANRPGVYTRVNKYLDWIKENSVF